MINKLHKEFLTDLKKLVGKPVWGIVAGSGTGSVVSLMIGKKIPLDKKLSNPHLTPDEREFEGEFSFLIQAPWRLDEGLNVLAASYQDNAKGGPMLKGLERIRNKVITEVVCISAGLDFALIIDGIYTLDIFCANFGETDDFYTFFTPEKSYTIRMEGKILVEDRENR